MQYQFSVSIVFIIAVFLSGCSKPEGKLRISSNKEGTNIYINGEIKAKTGKYLSYSELTLPEGEYEIKAEKVTEEYIHSTTKTVHVKGHASETLDLYLDKKPTEARINRLAREQIAAQEAYSEFNDFVKKNTKCCRVFRMIEDTSFFGELIKGGFSHILDLQAVRATVSTHKEPSIRLACESAQCSHHVYYKNNRVNELVSHNDGVLRLPFQNVAARNQALTMLRNLPKASGTTNSKIRNIMYSRPLVESVRSANSYIKNTTNSYSVVRSETEPTNQDIVTKFISCSNGRTKVVTTNESIGFYADTDGNKHSNFNQAALASCR